MKAYIICWLSKRCNTSSICREGNEDISSISAKGRGWFLDFKIFKTQSSALAIFERVFVAICKFARNRISLFHWLRNLRLRSWLASHYPCWYRRVIWPSCPDNGSRDEVSAGRNKLMFITLHFVLFEVFIGLRFNPEGWKYVRGSSSHYRRDRRAQKEACPFR